MIFVVNVEGNARRVCVRLVSGHQLEQLCERIQQRMKTLPQPKPYTWKSVQGCAVMGPDMLWHRGQVLEVLGEYLKVGEDTPCPFLSHVC